MKILLAFQRLVSKMTAGHTAEIPPELYYKTVLCDLIQYYHLVYSWFSFTLPLTPLNKDNIHASDGF